ncbi:MAG: SDR family NAD(P)-dependent oxidoreductase, partial [Sphingomonadaceae bacterium]
LWARLITVNFKAVLHACRAVLPHIRGRGPGVVVNVASDAGRVGSSGEAVYSGAKGVVTACFKALETDCTRIGMNLKVDYRAGPAGRLKSKTEKIEQRLGRKLSTGGDSAAARRAGATVGPWSDAAPAAQAERAGDRAWNCDSASTSPP